MGKFVKSKDNVYTIADKIANRIRTQKFSAKTYAACDKLGRKFLGVLVELGKQVILEKISARTLKTKVKKASKEHLNAVSKEIGKDLKVKIKAKINF